MSLRSLGMAVLAVWSAVQMWGQAPPHSPRPHNPIAKLMAPQGHARPASGDQPSTPTVYFDATSVGAPVVLDKNWRVGVTANQDPIKPDFDDSTWVVRDAQEIIAEVPDDDHPSTPPTPGESGERPRGPGHHSRPFAWFRLHVKLAPNHGPIALLLSVPVSQNSSMSLGTQGPGVDVYANGKEIHPEGPHGDDPQHFQAITRLYRLNIPASETSLVLVMRTIYIPFGYVAYTSFFANRTFLLGDPEDLSHSTELWSLHSLLERLPRLINAILLLFLAVFLLALYFTQPGHVEYLWLALHEIVQAPLGFIDLAGSTAQIDQVWYLAIFTQLVLISAYFYFEFLVSFLALRKRWYIRWLRYLAPVLAAVGASILYVVFGSNRGLAGALTIFVGLTSVVWIGGWLLFCSITLISSTVRKNFEAGLLLIPLVLSFIGMLEPIYTSSMSNIMGHPYHSPLTIQAGPIPIHLSAIADFAGMLAIVLIIFVRFLRIHRDRERASSELAAARSVQELMIPQERVNTPGFEVDSIYNPANEVGGDFYHVDSTPDGGLLVVIGDVAGKGLKAAMNVSMLMGALRRSVERSPAKILESLNRVLVGSESFTTCQAIWFGPNGEVTLANAGHLPPYLNSQEVHVPGGLPLGVIGSVSYDEVRLYLHPGDRILLLSDGVVEARHSSGELFGFERVHNLSNQTAFYIADAAREFGQEDDITVLTVRRLPQAVAA